MKLQILIVKSEPQERSEIQKGILLSCRLLAGKLNNVTSILLKQWGLEILNNFQQARCSKRKLTVQGSLVLIEDV